MAGKIFTGVQAFYGEFDVSGDANSFEVNRELEILEHRAFNLSYLAKSPGIRNDSATLAGQLSFEDPGTSFFNNLGTLVPVSVCLDGATAAEQDRAFLMNSLSGTLTGPVEQGQLYQFSLDLPSDSHLVFGYCLANGQKTASGNTASGASLDAVAAGQSIYAAIHCTAADSGTVDVIIESAATGDTSFSSPTTRLTFTQITTSATSEFVSSTSAAGITDTLWRAKWTGASTPDHTFMVAFGVA